jgi:DNA mismatch endonuclease (patch repair protein)
LVVFVDGDFWHGYNFEKWGPKLNEFWREKIQTNRRRDRRNAVSLRKDGWVVIRIWEHEVMKDPEKAASKVERWLLRRQKIASDKD